MSAAASASSFPASTDDMMKAFGITNLSAVMDVMRRTNAFFAGGACAELARSQATATPANFDPKGDLDIWVPCFNFHIGKYYSFSLPAFSYNKLALQTFKDVLETCGFVQKKKPMPISKNPRQDDTYRFDNGSYQIWRVDTYVHLVGGQKVQVIGVHPPFYSSECDSIDDSELLTPLKIVSVFDISVCRCFVTAVEWGKVQAPDGVLDEVKRGVFSVLPSNKIPDYDRLAQRISKYYGRGYVMEERVRCPTCKRDEFRALTEDEAIGYVVASMPAATPSMPATPVVKNTVAVSAVPAAPVKPAAAPCLVIVEDGEDRVAKKLFDEAPNKFAAYYKDLKPLLGEKTIKVNLEKDSRITTVRLYESVLRKALSNLAPHNKGVGKHLMFWRGATQFADYITDMAFDMVMEMSTNEGSMRAS